MVRAKKKDVRMYTPAELADLKDQRKDVESTIRHIQDNPGVARGGTIDKAALQKQSKYLDKEIHTHTPTTPRRASEKDSLYREAKELEAKLKEGMPTRHEMDHPARNPGAIHKHLNWAKRNEANIYRYKHIQRRLSPQDPTAVDREKLRREK